MGGDELSVFRRECIDTLPLLFQRSKRGFERRQLTAAGAVFVEPIGLGPEIDEGAAEIGQPGAGGKKQLAEIAFAGEDALAAGFERVVVQREHRAVGFPVEAAQFALQDALGNGAVIAIEEAVLLALDPDEIMRGTRDFQRGADRMVG